MTLTLLVLISAWPAAAQDALTIPQASLKLWPEYDDPGVLVIFAGDFANDATFPQDVAFPVAEGARNIQATVNDPAKGLLSQEWQMQGGKVAYSLPQPGFHLEYYVDRPVSGDQRKIVHTFEAPYPIKSLEIAVQQPARATDFSVTPAPSRTTTGADGLTYHIINLENLAAGEKRDIAISYVKTDSGLSSPQLALTSATPAPQAAAPAQPQASTACTDKLAAHLADRRGPARPDRHRCLLVRVAPPHDRTGKTCQTHSRQRAASTRHTTCARRRGGLLYAVRPHAAAR